MADFRSNPFPGMNPYLEVQWSDVHTALIAYIRDALSEHLPDDLRSLAEEHLTVMANGNEKSYRADIAVVDWDKNLPPLWQPDKESGLESVAAAEPEVLVVEPETNRWVEIRERTGELVTVIEVLSPRNKTTPSGRKEYRDKQTNLIRSGINLVEIDLLRCGEYVGLAEETLLRKHDPDQTRHIVTVFRAFCPNRREIYYCPLSKPLPTIRIPLRPSDPDTPLALQPLIDRSYQTGRCWHLDHSQDPPGADWATEESRWIDARLRQVGLRG